jgi:broad specificity polyphosphatase/5'/3'-nucleotidase SurE
VEVGDGMYKVKGECVYKPSGDLTLDTDAVMSGYISVMPITANITDAKIFRELTGAAK